MKNPILIWVIAIIITLASAYYQSITGPTYPKSGKVTFNGKDIEYKFVRSHPGTDDCSISIQTDDKDIKAYLAWKRYKTDDEWTKTEMKYFNGVHIAVLPNQPPAGKLMYEIQLEKVNTQLTVPEDKPVVIRFRGSVPATILIPHIIGMFCVMLLSTRAGLEIFRKEPQYKKLTLWTLGFLIVGGMILGPLVQKFAFGEYWTGFPFGMDLTDNKTLIALIGWIIALIAVYKFKKPKYWVLGAAVLTLVIFLIPHSVLGSELDYSKMKK